MSTVVVSNIHFESTGNNRIQIEGSNTSIYQAGQRIMSANSTEMTVNYKNSNTPIVSILSNEKSLNSQYVIGDILILPDDSSSTTPINFVNANARYLRSQYPALSAVVSNSNIDVTTWYNRTSTAGTNRQNGVAYGNGIYVAVGNSGTIQTSTDAVTWTSRTGANTSSQLAVTFGNGIFVSTGNIGSIQTSTDGITWTNITRANTLSQRGVTFGNGIYVAVGGNGEIGTIVTSTDAITWVNRTSDTANVIYDVAYGNGVFVAVGLNSTRQTSTDGVTWTLRTRANTTPDLLGVTYGNNIFVAVGGDGDGQPSIQTSTDGITWTNRVPAVQDNLIFTSVVYDANTGVYVAAGFTNFTGTGRMQVSTDAISWTILNPANTSSIDDITYGDGVFVAVGGSGHIQTTLSHASEFIAYSPYTSLDANIKTFVRAS